MNQTPFRRLRVHIFQATILTYITTSMTFAANETSGDVKAGNEVFKKQQCFTCHPGGGNVINPARPIKGEQFSKRFSEDAQISDTIRHGNPGTAMPAYSPDVLSESDLTDLIAYIRSLSKRKR